MQLEGLSHHAPRLVNGRLYAVMGHYTYLTSPGPWRRTDLVGKGQWPVGQERRRAKLSFLKCSEKGKVSVCTDTLVKDRIYWRCLASGPESGHLAGKGKRYQSQDWRVSADP